MSLMQNFKRVYRATGSVIMHATKPVWIVRYGDYERGGTKFWQAYRAVDTLPKGRMPWTVDNRRIGTDKGFKTLRDALNAAQAVSA